MNIGCKIEILSTGEGVGYILDKLLEPPSPQSNKLLLCQKNPCLLLQDVAGGV